MAVFVRYYYCHLQDLASTDLLVSVEGIARIRTGLHHHRRSGTHIE